MESQIFAERFLKRIRTFVSSKELNFDRLPKWVKCAKINFVKIYNSTILLFEDSIFEKDVFEDHGNSNSDLQFFLNLSTYIPKSVVFKAPDNYQTGLIILHGEYGEKGKVIFNIRSEDSVLFNVGYIKYHSPLALMNMFIQYSKKNIIQSIRFLPFVLYVHEKDYKEFEIFWEKCTPHIQKSLLFLHNSKAGDYYQKTKRKQMSILTHKEKSVIVLGKYGMPEEKELVIIRDYLISIGYEAYLLKELPESPNMTREQKVKLYSMASRFCVMVDSKASGHLVEYPFIKDLPTFLCILRQGRGSTSMIDYRDIKMNNYIESFQYEETPMEVIDKAVEWAENSIKQQREGL